ncbi:adenosine deaminase [Gleimia coleocanis]|uniref:adenosine deaminase n=1 Tax=Gleimia coleocanis TaxID=103618 RepID=UPI001145AEA7|nr:adenosine deaminase [Gleimia coleocanis]
MRDLAKLPKAHLHLHFTGAMRPSTLVDLAQQQGVRLPAHLLENDPLTVPANSRGWFRFQRSYDAARALVRSEAVMRRLIDEAIEDDVREGSVRLEIQVDPTSYAPWVGGLTPALEIILDQVKASSVKHGLSVGVIVAASRIRHPLDARTLARLAAQYAGTGDGEVVAFGLSNDEAAGVTSEFAPAFRLARKAGLPGVPHGGELLGPDHVRQVVSHLDPRRLGHGVRTVEDPRLLDELIEAGIGFELCPASNVSLGVFADLSRVPLRDLFTAGGLIALGADDPLLFRSRLLTQYEYAREAGFSDVEVAQLAASSIEISLASAEQKRIWQAQVDAWLANTM